MMVPVVGGCAAASTTTPAAVGQPSPPRFAQTTASYGQLFAGDYNGQYVHHQPPPQRHHYGDHYHQQRRTDLSIVPTAASLPPADNDFRGGYYGSGNANAAAYRHHNVFPPAYNTTYDCYGVPAHPSVLEDVVTDFAVPEPPPPQYHQYHQRPLLHHYEQRNEMSLPPSRHDNDNNDYSPYENHRDFAPVVVPVKSVGYK